MNDAVPPRTEEELRTLLTAIVQSSDDAIIGKTVQGIITSWNPGAERIYGYTASEAVGQHISLLSPPDRIDELREIMDKIGHGEHVEHLETVRLTKEGGRIDVSLTLSPIFGAEGAIIGISTIARDITDRKRMERMLRESEERYRHQIEFATDAVVLHQDGRFVYANCAALGIYGARSLAELQRMSVLDLVHEEDRAEVRDRLLQLLDGEQIPLREYRLLRLDGATLPIEAAATLIDYHGRPSIQVIARDISERKRAEKEREKLLEELEFLRARFETVVRQMPLGILIAEAPTGRLIFSNEEAKRILGAALHQVEGVADYGAWNIFGPDGARLSPEAYPLARALFQGETIIGEELRIERGDGARTMVAVNAAPIMDPDGRIDSCVVAITDITETKLAAQALRQSEERLSLALDSTGMGSCDMDAQSGTGIWSEHHFLLLGFPPPDGGSGPASIEMWHSRVHPDDLPQVLRDLEQARADHSLFRSEHRIIRANDGQTVWVNVLGHFLYGPTGTPESFIGVIFDVTERRATEEALRTSEAKFRRLFESNLVAIFFWHKDGKIIEANQAYCDLVGIPPEQCSADKLSWLDSTPPELFWRDFAAIDEIMAQGICKPYEKEFINRKDGRRVPVLSAGAKMTGREGEGIGFAIDLTELKRAEEARRESEATLQLAIETTGLGTFDWDLSSDRIAFSDIAKRHFGLPPEAELGYPAYLSLLHPEDRELVEQAVREACKPEGGGAYRVKYRAIGVRDGKERWISSRGQVFFDENGAPVRFVGACLDVSDIMLAEQTLKEEISERLRTVEELHKQEQLLIRQGRLAALGEMIANIAHQWRQPLNTLALIVQELPWYYDRNLFTKEYLETNVTRAMQVINHMSKTIDGFRNFFEPGKEKLSFRASEVLAKTISIVETAFNELNLKVEVEADQEIFVYGSPNEFSQVVLNILVNAKDAILERKVVQPLVAVRLFRANSRAVLTITDNAGGIPEGILDRIFDPYFTTKGPDRGTGIGLFMSKTIVEKNMNGTLSVRNVEQGAEFRIEV